MKLRNPTFNVGVSAFLTALLLASTVSAQYYEVTDLGAIGQTNVAWSINQLGDVVGWSRLIEGNSEGFMYSQANLKYVGFVGGTSTSNLVAVNNLGQGVGTSGTTHEDRRAFIWTGKHRVNLGTLGGDDSQGNGLNDLGQAVGWSKLEDNFSSRAFIWEDGVMRALPTLGGEHASARAINNLGQIVGTATDDPDSLQQYAVIWENEQIFRLPPLGGVHLPRSIHDNGDVAGFARLPEFQGRTRAVIWRDRELALQLGTLADGTVFEPIASSSASGINAHGVIVGMSTSATGDGQVPFVYQNGVMVRLDDLMPEPWVAHNVGPGGINDAGQIAVEAGIPGGNQSHALLLTPRQTANSTGILRR